MAQNRLDRPVSLRLVSCNPAALVEEPGLDRDIQKHIGARLRAMYDELRDQPIPDRFLDLLGKLDRNVTQEKRRGG
jgi:Anti-sigma factor NepR